jgi:perosamine synthetase
LYRQFEESIEQFFGRGHALAFMKGRVALYAILKAIGVGPGDEVIVPGYTCVMVPGPVIYSGATPVYADIDPRTFAVDPREVEAKMSPRTKAILVQHTYGLPAAVEELMRIADRHKIPIIEDCCHTFGGRLSGQLLGTFGKAAFFSSQWNKPFSTGLGGIALTRDIDLANRLREVQSEMAPPSFKASCMLAAQLLVHKVVTWPSTTAFVTRLFRWMTREGLVVGSSSKAEFGTTMPEKYAMRPGALQCRLGRCEVGRIEANRRHRQWVTRQYLRALPELGYAMPKWRGLDDLMVLRLPLRVANKQEALHKAARYGVEIGSWFECPLHPIETNQEAFGYHDGDCPNAEEAAREVINLPTHRRVREKDIRRTLAFVRDVCRQAGVESTGA